MPNTPRGYPYPAGSMPPAGPSQMQSMAEAIDTDVQKVAGDTGYITTGIVWMNSFHTGTAINGFRPFAYRRVGIMGFVSGTVQRDTAWVGGAQPLTMPANMWPARQVPSTEGYMDEAGRIWLYAAGGAGGQAVLNFVYPVAVL